MSQQTVMPVDVDDAESLYRMAMAGATDTAWRLSCYEEAMAALYDVIEARKIQIEAEATGSGDVRE